MMPPCRSFWVGRWCFLIMLMCSMTTRPLSRSTRRTLPRLPRSLPATTIPVSPFRTCACAMPSSDDLGGEGDDLGELPVAQLTRHRPEDARAHRVVVRLHQHHRVAVEADIGAVPPPHFLHGAHDHRPRHLTLLHGSVGCLLLSCADLVVPQRTQPLVRAPQNADPLGLLGARVVRDVEHRPWLDHGSPSRLTRPRASGPAGCASACPWTGAA